MEDDHDGNIEDYIPNNFQNKGIKKIFNLRKRKYKPTKVIKVEENNHRSHKYGKQGISVNILNDRRILQNNAKLFETTNYKDEEDSIFEDADESWVDINKLKPKKPTKFPKSYEIESEVYKLHVNGYTIKNYNKEMIPFENLKRASIPDNNNIPKIEKSHDIYKLKQTNISSSKGNTPLPLLKGVIDNNKIAVQSKNLTAKTKNIDYSYSSNMSYNTTPGNRMSTQMVQKSQFEPQANLHNILFNKPGNIQPNNFIVVSKL